MNLEKHRVIETDAKDSFVYDVLSSVVEIPKYIGLFKNLSSVKEKLGAHAQRYSSRDQIRNNSTDILILSGASASELWIFHMVSHAKKILVPASPLHFGVIWKQVFLKNVKFEGGFVLQHGGKKRKFYVLDNIALELPKTRKYISPIEGVSDFFKSVSNTKYVVLRWFENLPDIDEGEDIDVLIADEDAQVFVESMNHLPGTIPCDTYSVSGGKGFDYAGIAYYPPEKAREVLETRISHNEHFFVPNNEMHVRTLAFHAAYHKGEKSGISSKYNEVLVSKKPEHKYKEALEDLGLLVSSLEELDEELLKFSWQPPKDTLRRFSKHNKWVRRHFNFQNTKEDLSLSVFVLREKASEHGFVEEIEKILFSEGFSIFATKTLSGEELVAGKKYIRGGNWDCGPWPASGGDPHTAIVAFDVMPKKLSAGQKIQYPHVYNARIVEVKNRIRERLNERLSKEEACNMLHSSDNSEEALEYMDLLFPGEQEKFVQMAQEESKEFETSEEVLKDLTHNGRRAKVEKILHNGAPYIKKTFRKGRETFCAREVFVTKELGKDCSYIPTCIDSGPLHVVYPFYKNRLKLRHNRVIPLSIAKDSISALKFFYEKGYFVFDAHPTNIIFDAKEGVKIIDFEFVYKYKNKPASFEESYDIVGAPESFNDDQPSMHNKVIRKTYKRCWYPYIGLSLHSLRNDSLYMQHAKRFIFTLKVLPSVLFEDIWFFCKNNLHRVLLSVAHLINGVVNRFLGHSVK